MKHQFPNIEACDPRNCVSGRIMRCSRIINNVFRKYLKPFRVSNSQLSMLFTITKKEQVGQQELANLMHMDKSTVNRNLRRLIDKSWVQKKNKKLSTTLIGKEQLELIIPEWEKAMKEIEKTLEKEGMDSLTTLTKKLTL